jgi:uncharacterized protein (UPF0332 family)
MSLSEIQALIEKAKESNEVARSLARDRHYDFAASRAYYAMFYVAEALLAHLGQSYSKHSAVISAFGREYTKAGKLDAKFHQRLIDAQDLRHTGDYGIEEHVSKKQVAAVCEWADEFIAAAEKSLKKARRRPRL